MISIYLVVGKLFIVKKKKESFVNYKMLYKYLYCIVFFKYYYDQILIFEVRNLDFFVICYILFILCIIILN